MPRKNSCTWGLGDTSISTQKTESETTSCGGLGAVGICLKNVKTRQNETIYF